MQNTERDENKDRRLHDDPTRRRKDATHTKRQDAEDAQETSRDE